VLPWLRVSRFPLHNAFKRVDVLSVSYPAAYGRLWLRTLHKHIERTGEDGYPGSVSLCCVQSIPSSSPPPSAPLILTTTTTQHALHGFWDSARLELAKEGIGVTTVCPGTTYTPLKHTHYTTHYTLLTTHYTLHTTHYTKKVGQASKPLYRICQNQLVPQRTHRRWLAVWQDGRDHCKGIRARLGGA